MLYSLYFTVYFFFYFFFFFFFNDTATTEIYTLSLHDALPIFHPLKLTQGQAVAAVGTPHSHALDVGVRWWAESGAGRLGQQEAARSRASEGERDRLAVDSYGRRAEAPQVFGDEQTRCGGQSPVQGRGGRLGPAAGHGPAGDREAARDALEGGSGQAAGDEHVHALGMDADTGAVLARVAGAARQLDRADQRAEVTEEPSSRPVSRGAHLDPGAPVRPGAYHHRRAVRRGDHAGPVGPKARRP